MTLKISEIFTETPGARYIEDGPFSGELFREKYLIPYLKECKKSNQKLIIDLDDVYGYSTGFLEESFGGLIRKGFKKEEILNTVIFRSTMFKDEINDILSYIEENTNTLKLN